MTTICEQEQDINETATEPTPEASPEWDALAAKYGIPAGAPTDDLLAALRHTAKAPRDVTYETLMARVTEDDDAAVTEPSNASDTGETKDQDMEHKDQDPCGGPRDEPATDDRPVQSDSDKPA